MIENVHILNGDALLQQFPKEIKGNRIVARECLVDGTVDGVDLETFFKNRSEFLKTAYGAKPGDYERKVIEEFNKIQEIPANAEITLWFEKDLFCQVNMWFCVFLIDSYTNISKLSWVIPTTDMQLGFGGMNESALKTAYQQKMELDTAEIAAIVDLWKKYQAGKHEVLISIASEQLARFPFLKATLQANVDRFPSNKQLGRPQQRILKIINSLNTKEFGPVFRAFSKEEAIYGFGDLQLKRLMDQLLLDPNV